MLTPRKKIHSTRKILFKGGSNPQSCIKQDSEPDTLPTSYSSPSAPTVMYCHTEIQVADQISYLTLSQYTNTWPTRSNTDPIMLGAQQGNH